jgi:hypothetical protein
MKNKIKPRRLLATIILISIAYLVIIIAALHFLSPGYNPIKQTTSEYVVGRYGFLMTSVFLSMSIACMALVAGLYKTMPATSQSRIGLALVVIFAIQALVAMFFPVNPTGTPITASGLVHRIIGPIGFLCFTIGALLISDSLKKDKQFDTVQRPARILSWLILAMFIITTVGIITQSFGGLGQRILLALMVVWFILIALNLSSITESKKIKI